jgi:hypothetical protein
MVYTPQELAQPETLWRLFQYSMLDVSEEWEKDQEGPRKLKPRYHPTASVMLTRFIKHLTFITMERADCYPMAVAFGSCLYAFSPRAFCRVVALEDEEGFEERLKNIGRIKRQIEKRLENRFGDRVTASEPPEADERDVVQEALEVFTPWGTAHFPSEAFAARWPFSKQMSEYQRRHAIMCPRRGCAGVERLVEEWKIRRPYDPLETPAAVSLRVPRFSTGATSNPDDDEGFLDELRLSMVEVFDTSARQRSANLFRLFRVCVDGEEQGQFVAGVSQAIQSLRIPLDAIRVQVFGQDDEGEVLLAVFYLPDLDENASPQQIYHFMENGATFALTVWPVQEAGGGFTAGRGRVEFWPEEAAVPKTAAWYAAAVATASRGLELAQVMGDAARETDLRRRLQSLHRAMSTGSAQGGELAALAERLGPWLAELAERATQWVSALWTPRWAGVPATANTLRTETHRFVMEPGRITVTCGWQMADQYHPASIDLSWQANFPKPCDIWVQFRQPSTERVLAEIQLGTKLNGRARLSQARLGFDLTQEWGLTVVLKRVAA